MCHNMYCFLRRVICWLFLVPSYLSPQKIQEKTILYCLRQREIARPGRGIHAHLDVLGEQTEDVLDFPSARVDIGSKLVWEYIGMPSHITHEFPIVCSLQWVQRSFQISHTTTQVKLIQGKSKCWSNTN